MMLQVIIMEEFSRTELLIKNDFYEKKKQVDVYIKKSSAYKDLIRLVKKL